ncbi:hypothetical protein [Erythrobacter sp. HL-111]|uniref:hypothetical protein n=1 Tax=Erythrobacter sp. HL-111 TaxID=1798193 RepID=UPI00087A767C|nr:hypothetical protein [Erythrobacter sp. HL-111]SDS39827.1 Peptidase M15 [Erythrobacter sp. HL-111]
MRGALIAAGGLASGLAAVLAAPTPAQAQTEAPSQSRADYLAWLARSPQNRENVRAFSTFLAARGVDNVLSTWQLVRTSSSWRQCSAQPFEVAPVQQWANIVDTLAFVREEVVPSVGDLEVLSAYRNERLNSCSGGRPGSAHRMFFAMDLVPQDDITRGELIETLCRAHRRKGREYSTGLGFYSGIRFHIDSSGYRKWGADGRGASSPCNTLR